MELFDEVVAQTVRVYNILTHDERTRLYQGHRFYFDRDLPVSGKAEYVCTALVDDWWNKKSILLDKDIRHVVAGLTAAMAGPPSGLGDNLDETDLGLLLEKLNEFTVSARLVRDDLFRRLVPFSARAAYNAALNAGDADLAEKLLDETVAEVYEVPNWDEEGKEHEEEFKVARDNVRAAFEDSSVKSNA